MTNFIKKFETHSDYLEYIWGDGRNLPNVSYCADNNEIYYNPWVVTITFNVTDISQPTQIMGNASSTSDYTEIEIDGVLQPSVVGTYQFETTGEHVVKYRLYNPSKIGYRAFRECANLSSAVLPETIRNITDQAFFKCTNLMSINIPDTVTRIGLAGFGNCENLASIILPSSLLTIGNFAFQNCKSLTSIEIPSSITSIGNDAFRNCSGLTSIEIPSSITTWPFQMLYGCSSLTTVTIPNSVTSIGHDCFNRCSILSEIICERTTPPTLGANAFYAVPNLTVIYVPAESVEAYKTAPNWKSYASKIQAIPSE